MAVPTIDSTQSVLGYKAYETFSFAAGGSGSPEILFWQVTSLPAGLTLDAPSEKALTSPFGNETTDVITCVAHGFSNGDKVYFQSITGGSGLSALTAYYVRDKTDDTFSLSATLTGAAINFSTAITAGQIRKCGTSLITGSVSVPGIYVFGLNAVNATNGTLGYSTTGTAGTTTPTYFTLGIEASDGSNAVSGSSDTGIDVYIDAVTREVSLATASTSSALFMMKEDDTVILNVRFRKSGTALDPNPNHINIAFKELETEGVLFSAGGAVTTDWTKQGSGPSAVYKVPVVVTSAALASALANYEADTGTKFEALCEIEWRQAQSPPIGGVDKLIASSKTFKVTIERDLVV